MPFTSLPLLRAYPWLQSSRLPQLLIKEVVLTRKHLLTALFALALNACRNEPPVDPAGQVPPLADSGAAYVPGAQWRTASPAAAGFDPARIQTLIDGISSGRYGAIDGVLVIRYGYLVVEKYNGWSPTAVHTIQSVTKSITALLYGIAAQNGGLELDKPVLDLLSDYANVSNLDNRKRALTLGHLLSMRTSLDFWEQPYAGSPLEQLNRSSNDWVKLVLDRPMTGDPGTTWAYNSGAPIVICGVLRKATGEDVTHSRVAPCSRRLASAMKPVPQSL
jgi:CubicO group peptidase (beta-lactamase class C family)